MEDSEMNRNARVVHAQNGSHEYRCHPRKIRWQKNAILNGYNVATIQM